MLHGQETLPRLSSDTQKLTQWAGVCDLYEKVSKVNEMAVPSPL